MEFRLMIQITSIWTVIWFSCLLQSIECNPVSNSTLLTPSTTPNLTAELEYILSDEDLNEDGTNVSSHAVSNNLEEVATKSTDYAEASTEKKKSLKNQWSPLTVFYLCDMEKGTCHLKEDHGSHVTLVIPRHLLPDKQPPAEIGLKQLRFLVTMKKKLSMDSLDPNTLDLTAQGQQHSSEVHRRRRRDTQYAESNDNPQQEWANQVDNSGYQPYRTQRDVPSSTEPTSTEVQRAVRNVDTQIARQSKRSAEVDEEEVEDKDVGSPSPDDDYQDEEDTAEYQPEKRFAGPEATGDPSKSNGDSPTKTPLYRREVNRNFNYPFFASPDMYYPSQRLLSPFDGISYRSVNAMPMWYMGGYPRFWPGRGTRNPQQYEGYGRGWPPVPPYYQNYLSRYQPPSYQNQVQAHKARYQQPYHKQSLYNGYKPYSYGGYGQAKKTEQKPAPIKQVETDADMYYGKK